MSIFLDNYGCIRFWVFILPAIIVIGIAVAVLILGRSQEYSYRDFAGNEGVAEYCYQSINYKIMQCESKDGHHITVQEYWIKK